VRQVGYLLVLYRGARSTEYKIQENIFKTRVMARFSILTKQG